MIAWGGETPPPFPFIPSIPPCLKKRNHPMPRVLTAPVLILQFRLNQYTVTSRILHIRRGFAAAIDLVREEFTCKNDPMIARGGSHLCPPTAYLILNCLLIS